MVGRGQMQTRHDPFHYLPRFLRLEAKVAARSSAKLRDFVRALSGGATPKAEEQEKYYADSETGIPFVRVQNLSVSGQLQLDDVKYVNHETHNGLLARSQVKADDLLVKITGVGRMAVASVPSSGFEGNINQHIARIRTSDRCTSEVLAAWLNTDIAEALAKRRSTGGTRPALDYGALRSIPVIFDEAILDAVKAAYRQYSEALALASKKLEGIDDYLLAELGITLPRKPESTITNRIFKAHRRELTGSRFDPYFNEPFFVAFQNTLEQQPDYMRIREFGHIQRGVVYSSQDETDAGMPVLRANNINLALNELDLSDLVRINPELEFKPSQRAKVGDILICAASGSKEHAGKACYINEEPNAYLGGFMMALRCHDKDVMAEYVAYYMQSKLFRMTIFRHLGGTNINNISIEMLSRLGVVLPNKTTQERIVSEISCLRSQAKELRQQAEDELSAAKRRIETMLLGEVMP